MTVWLRIFMAIAILGFPLLTGCSNDQGKKEKSSIEQITDKAAKEAVESIKTPLDKARMAAEQENSRSRQVEEQEKKQ
ncbi:MAG: hypothetical protein V1844_06490 [Pseudomonadota bacterium]